MFLIGDAIDSINSAISNVFNTSNGLVTYTNIQVIKASIDSVQNNRLLSTEQKQQFAKSIQGSIHDLARHAQEVDYGYLNNQVHDAVGQLQSEVDNAVCFTRGTLISTPTGEVAVETLEPGDLVDTLSGPKPVKWMGVRTLRHLHAFSTQGKLNTLPVRISTNAIADGVPSRDISVSAWHHLYINKVLVRAMDVINEYTIRRDEVDEVTYCHVELERYDMLLAANLYSESFTDNGRNRGFFENTSLTELAPDWARQRGPAPRPGFTVVRPGDGNGAVLEGIKQYLDERAQSLMENGHVAVSA